MIGPAVASEPQGSRGSGAADSTPRRRAPYLIAGIVALVAVAAVAVALVIHDRGSTRPRGAPRTQAARLQIVSLPTLSYSSAEYTTRPGRNEIEFVSAGTHTLVFDDPALRSFELASSDNRPGRATVDLSAGRDYTVHCSIPGHVRAGERAVIHVTARR